MCELLTHRPDVLANRSSIIELGAGMGLAGILASLVAPEASVVLTDHDAEVCLECQRCEASGLLAARF